MNLFDFLKGLFFVPRCAVCGRECEAGCLCGHCRTKYEQEKKKTCGVCHGRYDACQCRPQFASPYIASYRRVTYYSEERVSGRLVLEAKSRANRELNGFLASEMALCAKMQGVSSDVIVYVPCSEHSYMKKGFDHGAQLANALGRRMGIPVVNCLVRKKGSEQKKLGAAERLDNCKESLFAKRGAEKRIAGKRVLLVDDIMTTGASALVASVHLNEMGADRIDFLSFGGR